VKPMEADERDVAEAIVTYITSGDDSVASGAGTLTFGSSMVNPWAMLVGPARFRARVSDGARYDGLGPDEDYEIELVVRRRRR
jgi:hypothetical protein